MKHHNQIRRVRQNSVTYINYVSQTSSAPLQTASTSADPNSVLTKMNSWQELRLTEFREVSPPAQAIQG